MAEIYQENGKPRTAKDEGPKTRSCRNNSAEIRISSVEKKQLEMQNHDE